MGNVKNWVPDEYERKSPYGKKAERDIKSEVCQQFKPDDNFDYEIKINSAMLLLSGKAPDSPYTASNVSIDELLTDKPNEARRGE